MNKELKVYLDENSYKVSIQMLLEFIDNDYCLSNKVNRITNCLENTNENKIEILCLLKLKSIIEDEIILSIIDELLK